MQKKVFMHTFHSLADISLWLVSSSGFDNINPIIILDKQPIAL